MGGLSAQQTEEFAGYDPCQALENDTLFRPLKDIKTGIPRDGKRLPPDCTVGYSVGTVSGNQPRAKVITPFSWQATDFFHWPLYFDDQPLERYGQTKHPMLQPAVSGAKFFLTLPILPYKMGVDRPHDCISTLGHQPPGSCVPCIKQTIPLEADAAFFEAAAAVGLVLLLP
jgi:hypothetical protein